MPVYEYKCEHCNNIIEKFYSTYKDRENVLFCNKCNNKLKLIISNTSFVLKGDGWANAGYQKQK